MAAKKVTKKKHDLGVKAGDVFAGPLGDGKYGAVRVRRVVEDGMRRGRDSADLVCTAYFAEGLPKIDDPALRTILRERRFAYTGRPAVVIVDEPPPPDFVLVGNFPVTPEEKRIDMRGTYGTGWSLVSCVAMEWRWEHDRAAFIAEVEGEQAARAEARRVAEVAAKAGVSPGPRKRTPRSKLTEDDFWALVALVDAKALAAGDADDEAFEPLIAALAKRSAADIREWHELLAHKLWLLDGEAFAEHAGDAGQSDDGFLYARCFVVARGKAFYEGVLRAPKKFPADVDAETLLGVANEAYVRKTDDDLEDATHYSYETGSNAAAWP